MSTPPSNAKMPWLAFLAQLLLILIGPLPERTLRSAVRAGHGRGPPCTVVGSADP
ncbi:hypothetical protein [Streptomyces sp. F001]|uniref:hypothetical protein n=1 Tax=Streptomyces sp. F001 TaxID=1510026 RepID=UPI0013EE5921|nr:hypothetical protein [Streptomyces sp. F001]